MNSKFDGKRRGHISTLVTVILVRTLHLI